MSSPPTTGDEPLRAQPSQWWRGRDTGVGLTNAFDMQRVKCAFSGQQTIEVHQHPLFGWVLVLDGEFKCAQFDSVLRESTVHIPLLGRRRQDTKVLLLGGGSGELLAETLRHDWVSRVVIVECDPMLVGIAKDQLGFDAAFADPRAELIIGSAEHAVAKLQQSGQQFDVIVVDWYDTAGRPRCGDVGLPGLRQPSAVAALLRDDGVAVDVRSVLLDSRDRRPFCPSDDESRPRLLDTLAAEGQLAAAQCCQVLSPLHAGGMLALFLYSKDGHSYASPERSYRGMSYNPAAHRAAFVLPTWWGDAVEQLRTEPFRTLRPLDEDRTGKRSVWLEQTEHSGISQALTMLLVHRRQSALQEIEIYQHDVFGRLLVLDGTVQGSQADEFIYHEMAVQVPMLGRAREQVRALIIGGGDGGIVRELLRHDNLHSVVMVEIDDAVVESSNAYFGVQGDYQDPRVELIIGDAANYVAKAAAAGALFELIIVDATDSTATSDSLWNDAFFANLAACLTDDGVCVDSDIVISGNRARLSRDAPNASLRDVRRAKQRFASVASYYTKVPLFPGGCFMFLLYSKDGHSYSEPYKEYTGLHYNAHLHRAAFALPSWWQDALMRL